jgi:hypothetical protein
MADTVSTTGYVYFIREGRKGPIKIGYAANPQARIYNIQCGNPRALRFIGMVPGTRDDESEWHRRFDKLRIGGEWFRAAHDLTSAIDRLPRVELPRGVADRGSTEVSPNDWHKRMTREARRGPGVTPEQVREAMIAAENRQPVKAPLFSERHINRGEVA